MRATDDKPASGVDVIDRLVVEQFRRDDVLDELLDHVLTDRFVRDLRCVLRRDHDSIDTRRLAVHVLHRDLTLAVGPQIVNLAGPTEARQLVHEIPGKRQGQRHQLGSLVARVPEHQSLVARPLLLVQPLSLADAKRDIL